MKRLYLDYNATTPLLPDVEKAFKKSCKQFGNPSSLHAHGREAKEALETARETIASHLGCGPHQLLFTSGATEANNMVLHSILWKKLTTHTPGHIITTPAEHSSIAKLCPKLKAYGIDIDTAPVNSQGELDPADIKALIKPHTQLITVMTANNETGVKSPISEIARLAKDHNILFHTDAVHAPGKINISPLDDIDFLTLSAHKCYGPKGVGVLYVKNDTTLNPFIIGGSHERKLRAGTENMHGICAAGIAFDWVFTHQSQLIAHFEDLHTHFLTQLDAHCDGFSLNGAPNNKIHNTINLSFEGCNGHSLAINLDLAGISVSTGSACSVGAIQPSHVLRAMGLSDERTKEAIRISFGYSTTTQELDYFVSVLAKIVKQMR